MQSILSVIALISNVVLNAILIPTTGINGAALGTGLSYLITAILLMLVMRRTFRLRIGI